MSLEQDLIGQPCRFTHTDGTEYDGVLLDLAHPTEDHTRALVEVPEQAIGGGVSGTVEINTNWENVEVDF